MMVAQQPTSFCCLFVGSCGNAPLLGSELTSDSTEEEVRFARITFFLKLLLLFVGIAEEAANVVVLPLIKSEMCA
jgi:hypothetical protein